MLTKTKLICVAMLFCTANQAEAQSTKDLYDQDMKGSPFNNQTITQDARSGNTYNTTRNSDGSTSTYSTNQRTGTMWRNQTQPDGQQSGSDANGNQWHSR